MRIIQFDYQSVFACKCESIDDIKTEFNSTDVIVRGKVISKEYVTFISTLNKKGLKKINSNNALDNDKKELLKNKDILSENEFVFPDSEAVFVEEE